MNTFIIQYPLKPKTVILVIQSNSLPAALNVADHYLITYLKENPKQTPPNSIMMLDVGEVHSITPVDD